MTARCSAIESRAFNSKTGKERDNADHDDEKDESNRWKDFTAKKPWMKGTVFDDDLKEERRDEIRTVLQRGVGLIGDVRELKHSNGKLFRASAELVPFAEADRFPDIGELQPLDPLLPQRRITSAMQFSTSLVLLSFNSFGREQVQEWLTAFGPEGLNNPGLKILELSVSDNWGARMIESWLRSGLRRSIDQSLHATFFPLFHADTIQLMNAGLGIQNQLVPYVFLVDSHGLVRWAGTGKPGGGELDALRVLSESLINEQVGNDSWGLGGKRKRKRKGVNPKKLT
jgi:hypothetical protein